MMVDIPVILNPHLVNECVKKNLKERNELSKYQPDINHLNVGGGWHAAGDTDEEGGEDEECCEVDTDNGFEKEGFEEVCDVHNDQDQHGGEVGCQKLIFNSSFKKYYHPDPFGKITCK